MTRDDIERLALKAGFEAGNGIGIWNFEIFQRFTNFVADTVREECASIADQHSAPIVAAKIRGGK